LNQSVIAADNYLLATSQSLLGVNITLAEALPALVCTLVVIVTAYKMTRTTKRAGYESALYWNERYVISKREAIHAYEWYFVDHTLVDVALRLLQSMSPRRSAPPVDEACLCDAGAFKNIDKSVALAVDAAHRSELLIVDLGIGQSLYSDHLYDAGYTNITAIDFSDEVIRQRTATNTQRPRMRFECMDARRLKMKNDSVDLIVDKATFDSIIVDKKAFLPAKQVMAECHRVLKPGGLCLSISINNPTLFAQFYAHDGMEIVDVVAVSGEYDVDDGKHAHYAIETVTPTPTLLERFGTRYATAPLVRHVNNKNMNFYVYKLRKKL
jgi:SAM-dependent methyltransferase